MLGAVVLAALALALVPLPWTRIWGQTPPTSQPEVERLGSRQNDALREKLQALEKAQADIRRMQEELDRTRRDLERRTQDLNRTMEAVRKAAQEPGSAPTVERKSSTAKPGPGARAGAAPGYPTMTPPAEKPAAGMPGPDIDKRLREVERKLDLILQMMRRGQPSAGGPVPPAVAEVVPVAPPPPGAAPRDIGLDPQPALAPAAPTPARALPRPGAQPPVALPPNAPLAAPAPELPAPPVAPQPARPTRRSGGQPPVATPPAVPQAAPLPEVPAAPLE
jgi:hypothetical protein